MASRDTIAIDLGRRRLRAARLRSDDGTIRIEAAVVCDIPVTLNRQDPEALGAWLGQTLRDAGVEMHAAIVSIPREQIGIKHLTLPTADPVELPEMTRLSMQRELTFDADRAVIDFVVLEQDEQRSTVLAAAVPDDTLDAARRMIDAAGGTLEQVSLRNVGVAALLPRATKESVLAVDVTGDTIEFNIIVDGAIRFTRAADLPPSDTEPDAAAMAQTILTETRRTWMSYRIVDDSGDVHRAVLFGEVDACAEAKRGLTEMLGIPVDHVQAQANVQCASGVDAGVVWPLAGIALARERKLDTIDFMHPTQPPDVAARRRQIVLGVAAVYLIVAMAGWTFGNKSFQNLQAESDALNEQRPAALKLFYRLYRDRDKLQHLTMWEDGRADWLSHLSHLADKLPPRDSIVLDEWLGSYDTRGVKWNRKDKEWTVDEGIRITLRGEASDRETANTLRDRLVSDDIYVTESGGTESEGGQRLAHEFLYTLQTPLTAPPVEPEVADASKGTS